VGQSHALAESLFTKEDGGSPPANDSLRETPQSNANNRNEQQQVPAPNPRAPKSSSSRSKKKKKSSNTNRAATSEQSSNSDILFSFHDPDTMIQGGAFIPPNQQRNMRACMVCSIVRTQQQFTTQGCPNCEDVLELAGNPEQVNDCTSQVFEGIITIADTTRSWVARYQRLEGYVPGVYATQVEGILPEEVLVAVENAGINYVPRDGSEQEMLGKE
jgi:transcription elongation factor SPT4